MTYEELVQNASIRPTLRVYGFADDQLQFGVFPENQIVLKDPTHITQMILEKSRDNTPLAEVRRELLAEGFDDDVVAGALTRLHRLRILEESATATDRYDRQRRFFDIFREQPLPGAMYQDYLRRSVVLVLGLTAAGAKVAHELAGAGVGRIVAVDAAMLEPDDIAHQHLFPTSAVGLPRAVAFERVIERLNPGCSFNVARRLDELSSEERQRITLCIACAGRQFPAVAVEAFCASAGTPFILFGTARGLGVVEPIIIPDRTPCLRCIDSPFIDATADLADVKGPQLERGIVESATANLVALEALKFLARFARPDNAGARLWIDLAGEGMSIERHDPAEPCARCRGRAATAVRFAALDGGAPLGLEPELDARIEFHALVHTREAEAVLVGREATGTFISVGELEWKYLRLLQQGFSVRQAAEAFKEHFGIPDLKVGAFFATLADAAFLNTIDGFPIAARRDAKRYLLASLQPRHVAFLFSRPLLALYALFIAVAAGTIVLCPQYLPRYGDIYFTSSVSITLVVNALVGWLAVVPHELAHLCAAKSVGCDGRISIGHRLTFVVVQSDVTSLWKVPRSRRHIVYLAGMMSDALIGAAAIYMLWGMDHGVVSMHPLFYRFLKALVYLMAFRIVWNFLFYMRTDVYYFLSNLLGCKNLYEDTKAFIRNELARELRWITPVSLDTVPARELRWVHLYAVFFLIGTALTIAAFSVALLPIGLTFRNAIWGGVAHGYQGRELTFLDSAVASGLVLFNLALLAYAIARDRRRRTHGR